MRPSITAQKFVVLEGRSELKFNFYFQEGYYVGHGHVPLVVNRLAGAMSLKSTPMLGKRSIAARTARTVFHTFPSLPVVPARSGSARLGKKRRVPLVPGTFAA